MIANEEALHSLGITPALWWEKALVIVLCPLIYLSMCLAEHYYKS